MPLTRYNTCVLFGGNGFIGRHFAVHLLETGRAENVILVDAAPADALSWPKPLKELFEKKSRVKYVQLDVRQSIAHAGLPATADLIINLAAVHREPGHQPREYFDTNLPGAENVCRWAEAVGCNSIVYTSSISVYGPADSSGAEKTEESPPSPTSPYGKSKLAAEKIHADWQAAAADRKLLIVRPGVIFGPGENGNITHMIHALLKGYFFYVGNRKTSKAGGYVKELCSAITWMMDWQDNSGEKLVLFNFTMDPAPTVEDYVVAIRRVAKIKRPVIGAPYSLLLAGSYLAQAVGTILRIKQPINPVRVRKLRRSNNIAPKKLRDSGYQYGYTLEQALADWLKDRPEDWA